MPLRSALLAAVILALTVGRAAPAFATDGAASLRQAIDLAIASFNGSASVAVLDPLHGVGYEHDVARIVPAASLYKLAVLVEVYRQANAGQLSLDGSTVTIEDDDLVDGGTLTDDGTTLSVREALERMITMSDNACARALLRTVGTHIVNATALALGLTDTRINTTLPAEERSADYNTTSARDMERLFSGLVKGTILDAQSSTAMLAVLGRQQVNDRIPSGLPDGTPVAHKTGNLDGIAHDVGVVTTPFGPRVVVVLTQDYVDYADVIALAAAVAHDAFSLPIERFAATISSPLLSAVTPGRPFTATVRVTNDSTFQWTGTYDLASHWRNTAGTYVRWDGDRATLPALKPGESVQVIFRGTAPNTTEPIGVLELDVVHEGVAWAGTPVRAIVLFAK